MAIESRHRVSRRAVARPFHPKRGSGSSISIIGAGRLGTALGLALSRHGWKIDAVVSKTTQHSRRAARLIGDTTLPLTSKTLERLPNSDILFLTVPDGAIEDVARTVADLPRQPATGRIALHASGALSSGVLNSMRGVGFAVGSMHPLVSISDAEHGANSLSSAFFCVEGDPAAVRAARRLIRSMDARSFSIKTADKALYHAAAVMSAGHIVALLDIAIEMLSECGLTAKNAREVLTPLLQSTTDNLRTQDTSKALTGPFARAEVETIRKHLASIADARLTAALDAYTVLGNRSIRIARRNHIDRSKLDQISELLKHIYPEHVGR
jgi:predicted short-subunit dehydrogenase-like oxidoreductase (DUF2520 family)